MKVCTYASMIRAAAIIAGALLTPTAAAQTAATYPAKSIRLVIPFPPAGLTDILARTVANELQKSWGQPTIPDNRPGASGSIGAEIVAKSVPDGHTLFLGHIGTHGVNPSLFSKLPYDPVKDFIPVSLLVSVSNLMVAHPSVPASNLKELIALAKSKPGTITFASPGSGTSGHMSGELLKAMTGVNIVHVPYKGQGPATQDLLGGQVHLLFDTIFSQMGNVKAGKLKSFGITSRERNALMPDMPTIAEQGVTGYEIGPWFGLLAPAGTPTDVVQKLNAEVVRIMKSDDVSKRFTGQGATIIASTSDEFATHIRNEIAKWGKVVKESGARAD